MQFLIAVALPKMYISPGKDFVLILPVAPVSQDRSPYISTEDPGMTSRSPVYLAPLLPDIIIPPLFSLTLLATGAGIKTLVRA